MTKQSETRDQVLDLIEQLGVGESIPSERQLSADLGVSRLTVRAALDGLVREGWPVREAPGPGLTAADLQAGSFYALLRERYGIVIAGGIQTIEPTVTDEEESAALGVPLHSPAFLFERFSRAETGEIVEFVQSTYRGDRYRIVTDLSGGVETLRPQAVVARGS